MTVREKAYRADERRRVLDEVERRLSEGWFVLHGAEVVTIAMVRRILREMRGE